MMKNKSAGERKRTITVTLGPKTEAILQQILDQMIADTGCSNLTLTACASAMLDSGIRASCANRGIELSKGMHFPYQ
jgi:hypothetical protein